MSGLTIRIAFLFCFFKFSASAGRAASGCGDYVLKGHPIGNTMEKQRRRLLSIITAMANAFV